MRSFEINDVVVGSGRCYVIAEAGVNHNGDLDLGLALVDAAADTGADAVKFQTFRADRIASRSAPKAAYQIVESGDDSSQHDMIAALELSERDHLTLWERATERGIAFLSTPFDVESAEFLVRLGVPVLKVSSGDLTALPIVSRFADHGLPILASTGMGTMGEVSEMAVMLETAGVAFALFHCVSEYPAPIQASNLRAIGTLRKAFDVPVGWSDHTLGITAPLAAAALGADLIEKHLTLDPAMAGPDHAASLDPGEFTAMVDGIRDVEAALGDGVKIPTEGELAMRDVARRSIAAARAIPAGSVLGASDIELLRPGTGIHPRHTQIVLGRTLRRDVFAGEILRLEDLE